MKSGRPHFFVASLNRDYDFQVLVLFLVLPMDLFKVLYKISSFFCWFDGFIFSLQISECFPVVKFDITMFNQISISNGHGQKVEFEMFI